MALIANCSGNGEKGREKNKMYFLINLSMGVIRHPFRKGQHWCILQLCTSIDSKLIRNLNLKSEITYTLGENMNKLLYILGVWNTFLFVTQIQKQLSHM